MPSKEDKKWMARMDADTLRESAAIMADKKRKTAAQSAARKAANEFARAAGGTGGKPVGGKGIVKFNE